MLSGVIMAQQYRSVSMPKLYSSGSQPLLIPHLLKNWWAIIDIPHLDDDSGAGLHSSHTQGTHNQKVGRCLLSKQSMQ